MSRKSAVRVAAVAAVVAALALGAVATASASRDQEPRRFPSGLVKNPSDLIEHPSDVIAPVPDDITDEVTGPLKPESADTTAPAEDPRG